MYIIRSTLRTTIQAIEGGFPTTFNDFSATAYSREH